MKHVLALFGCLVLLAGCSDKSKIESKAVWLCKRGHLDKPQPGSFPEGHKASEYIAAKDLAALTDEEGDRGMFAAMAASLEKVAIGAREGIAEHTTCDLTSLTIDDAGERATLVLRQTRPRWEPKAVEVLGELAKLETTSAIQKRVSEMIEDADPEEETSERSMTFVKEGGNWVALLDVEKLKQRKKVEAEIAKAEEKLAATTEDLKLASAAAVELAKLEVTSAKFSKLTPQYGPERPLLEISVKNGTGKTVSQVTFLGRLVSAGRSVPWLEAELSYSVPGGLEPSESASWSLGPNPFSEWGSVEVPADVELKLEVVRLYDAAEVVIAEVPRDKSSFRAKPRSVTTLEAESAALATQLEELRKQREALL